MCGEIISEMDVHVLTSEEVMKEVSFRKQLLDRGLLLVLRWSKESRNPKEEHLKFIFHFIMT